LKKGLNPKGFLILSARPGTQAWFSHAAKAGLTFFEEFPQEAKDKLLSRYPSKIRTNSPLK
jgi:hypothetical protein